MRERRTLPFAALGLWGCLLTLGLAIHPMMRNGQASRPAAPFFTARGMGVDYYQFWVVGRARERLQLDNIYAPPARQRMEDLGRELLASQPSERLAYSVEYRQHGVEAFSTPFLYAMVDLFASGQYDRDYDRFMDLCLAGLVFASLAMGWLLGFSLAETLLFVAVVVLWSEPLASDLRVGNVNQLQLAGVALYLLCLCRPESRLLEISGGLILGLLVAFKPTLGVIPLLLAPAWVIDRRWRTLLQQGMAALAALGIALGVGCRFLHSWSAWSNWANALPELEKVSDISVDTGNYSLAEVLREATGGPAAGGISLVLLLLVLGAATAACYRTHRRAAGTASDPATRVERDFLVTAMGCALSVVALKLVWLHYYLLMIPLLLYLLRPSARVGLDAPARLETARLAVALLALAAVFGRPFASLIDLGPGGRVSLYIAGAWILLLLGLKELWVPTLASQPARAPNHP